LFFENEKLSLKNNNKKIQKFWQALSTAFTFGFSIALPITGGAILGYMIDNKLNTHPKATLSLLFTGLYAAAGIIYQTTKKENE